MLIRNLFAGVVALLASSQPSGCSRDFEADQKTDESAASLAKPTICPDCGRHCRPGPRCWHGRCCAEGLTNCAGACVDLDTSATDCGACGNACEAGAACSNGLCCPAGQTNCGGTCVDLTADPNHCGTCDVACPVGVSCSTGLCCGSGQTNCDGACINLATSSAHCGSCATACPSDQTCSQSVCVPMVANITILSRPGFFVNESFMKTWINLTNTGNVPTGSLTLTNSNPEYFFVEFQGCSSFLNPVSHAIDPGGGCSISVMFVHDPRLVFVVPGLHAADVTISGTPGGTVSIHLEGRIMLADGQTGCAGPLDCVPPGGCPCALSGICPPCLDGGTCLPAFIDLDRDGYGGPTPTTVCNRIVPSPLPPSFAASLTSNDCDDNNFAIFPGSSICSSTDPNARIVCHDDGSLETIACSDGACASGQCPASAAMR